MSDIHALVGAYAVDAVDDIERAAFERHLAGCPVCQQEVEGLRETSGLLGSTEPVAAPDRMREGVLSGIQTIRPLPPLTTTLQREGGRRSRRFRPATLVAAAAAVIALGAGATVWQQVSDDDTSQAPTVTEATEVDRVLAAPDAEEYTRQVNGAEITVVRSPTLNQAVLMAEDMPAAPDGKIYELWLDHGEGFVPAGLMTGQEEQVLFEGDPGTAVGAGITIEPAPDGSKAPTSPAVTSFTFEKA